MQRNWRVWGTAAASLAMLELAVVGKGCGGSSTGPGSPDGTVVVTEPDLNVSGGAATSSGGQGQAGGTIHMVASGDITIDPSMKAAGGAAPQAPAGVMAIDAAALAADVNAPGSAIISGRSEEHTSELQ